MCGRFSLIITPEQFLEFLGLPAPAAMEPRYNIAPTQMVPAVRCAPDGRLSLALLRWGLIPEWADDPKIGNSLLNARCETLATKPAFRRAFRTRRCLVPASGFYEWRREGKNRQPYHLARRDGGPMAFAGIWERWEGPSGAVESCAIVTTEASPLVRPLHDRMPVILPPEVFPRWLDPAVSDVKLLKSLLTACAGDDLVATPVSSFVNKAGHEGPECLAPAASLPLF